MKPTYSDSPRPTDSKNVSSVKLRQREEGLTPRAQVRSREKLTQKLPPLKVPAGRRGPHFDGQAAPPTGEKKPSSEVQKVRDTDG